MKSWFHVIRVEGDRIIGRLFIHGELSEKEITFRAINSEALSKVRGALGRDIHDLEIDYLADFIFDITDYGPSLIEKAEKLSQDLEKSRRPVFHSLMASEEEDQPRRLSDSELSDLLDRAASDVIAGNRGVRSHRRRLFSNG